MFQTTALQISHSLTSSLVKWKADESGLASCSTPKLRVRPAWHFWREDRTYVAAIHKLTSGWDGVWEHRWKCKSAVWHIRRKKGNISRVHSRPTRSTVCPTLCHPPAECVLWTSHARLTALIWGKNWWGLYTFSLLSSFLVYELFRGSGSRIRAFNLFYCNAFRWAGFKYPLKCLLSCWHRSGPLEN